MVVKIYWENGENDGERASRSDILKFLPRLNYTDFIVVQANFRNYRRFIAAAELLRVQRVIVKKMRLMDEPRLLFPVSSLSASGEREETGIIIIRRKRAASSVQQECRSDR